MKDWLNELTRCGRGIYHERRYKLWPEVLEVVRAADQEHGHVVDEDCKTMECGLCAVIASLAALKAKVESL